MAGGLMIRTAGVCSRVVVSASLALLLFGLLISALLLLLVGFGWQNRVSLLPILLLRYALIDLELSDINATCVWAPHPVQRLRELDVPVDRCTLFLDDVTVFTPFHERIHTRKKGVLGRLFESSASRARDDAAIGAAAEAAAEAAASVASSQSAVRPPSRVGGRSTRLAASGSKLTRHLPAAKASAAAGAPAIAAAASLAAKEAAARALRGELPTSPPASPAAAAAGSVPATPPPPSPPPPGRDVLARAQTVTVDIRRNSKRRYVARVVVGAPRIRFVSYDHRFADTNVRRLLAVLAGSLPPQPASGSERGPPPPPPTEVAPGGKVQQKPAPSSAPAPAPAPSPLSAELGALVEVRSVELLRGRLDIVLNLSPLPTGGVLVLPPLTVLAEKVDLAAPTAAGHGGTAGAEGKAGAGGARSRPRAGGGFGDGAEREEEASADSHALAASAPLSIGLLLQLNALAFRALASSSVDAVASSVVAATAAAAAVLGYSLQVVNSVNGPLLALGLPGAELLHGATGGARALVDGALAGSGALLSGGVEATKLLAAALSSGSAAETARGIERGVSVLNAGFQGSLSALTAGLSSGLSIGLSGVDALADRFGPAGLVVRGVTDSARYVTSGVGSAANSVVGSILDGGTQLVRDVAVGGARTGLGLATLDVEHVLAGSGQVVGGLARGAGTLSAGVRDGVGAIGSGALRGIESATQGVSNAAGEVLSTVADTGAKARRFWLRPFGLGQRADGEVKGEPRAAGNTQPGGAAEARKPGVAETAVPNGVRAQPRQAQQPPPQPGEAEHGPRRPPPR